MADEATLSDRLVANARAFARSAVLGRLVNESDDDWRFSILHAATAMEQVLKAALARQSPALIAASDAESLFYFTGLGRLARRKAHTIGPSEALSRATRLIPELNRWRGSLETLMSIRNGVVHLSEEAPPDVDGLLGDFLVAANSVLESLEISGEVFWEGLWDVVANRLEGRAAETRALVAERVAAARIRFERQYRDFSREQRAALRELIEKDFRFRRNWTLLDEAVVLEECPACKELAFVGGTVSVDWELEEEGWNGYMTFAPSTFFCTTCGLRLDGDEIAEAGIEPRTPSGLSPHDFSEPPEITDLPGMTDEEWHPYGRP